MKPGSSYRADVDGLRAVAVLAVVFFHLHVGFSGGYVGVDVFFVISGYLITGYVLNELRSGTFSLKAFYLRRLRRLAPALVLCSMLVSAIAWCVLYPEDLRSFGASLGLQFVALQNFFFLAVGEYFRGSDSKPLLHTWSLAVEEQFYLVWPLLLLLTRRFSLLKKGLLLGALMAVSFGLNLALFAVSPKASFFMLPPRAWELGIGGMVAMLEQEGLLTGWASPSMRSAVGALGLAMILFSIFVLDSNTAFPGWAALLPVAGAALVIVAGIGGSNSVGRILEHPAVVHVGLISYPLYLWHWPIIAFLHYTHRDPGSPGYAVLTCLGSGVLAEFTFRFVERPIRDRRWFPSSRSLLLASAASVGALALVAGHLYLSLGAAYRFEPAARALLTAPFRSRIDRCGTVFRMLHPRDQVCALSRAAVPKRKVLLWGNSHGDMWSGMLAELAKEHQASLYLNARNCRATSDSAFCGPVVQKSILQFIVGEQITDVVLASSWYGEYEINDETLEKSLEAVVANLEGLSVRIWLVVDTPRGLLLDPITAFEKNPSAPAPGKVPLSEFRPRQQRELSYFSQLASRHKDVNVIDPSSGLCDAEVCSAGRGNVIWYRDWSHVTDEGARTATGQFAPIFLNAR